MDENNRQRRQNDPPYTGTDPRYGGQQRGGFSSSSTDSRYRQTPMTTSPSTTRASGTATAYAAGYYPEQPSAFPAALSTTPLGYQQGYAQDQRQPQGFTTYNQELMYNVAQQTSQTNLYDSTQQFQARPPAGMHLLSDVAAPYFPNEPTSAPGPPTLQHHASSGSSAVYQSQQQSPGDRGSLLQQTFASEVAMGGLQQSPAAALDEEEFQVQQQGPGMEQAYTQYQTALKEVFQNIIQGRLAVAAQSLLNISEWLLGHVGDLGLTVDEHALHTDRIRLWGEFNTAWLGLFQKQKDLLEAGQRSPNLMTRDFISKMAKDLIRMCDTVEKHGLVDYQYGVAEEQIIMILEECLDVQESIEGVDDGAPGRAPS